MAACARCRRQRSSAQSQAHGSPGALALLASHHRKAPRQTPWKFRRREMPRALREMRPSCCASRGPPRRSEPAWKASRPSGPQAPVENLQHEQSPTRFFFFAARTGSDLLLVERFCLGVMLPLDLGQVAQQLANRGIGHVADGALIEAPRFKFHHLGLLADILDSQRAHEPFRAALDKAFYILTANQRDVLAEFLA